MRIRRALLVCTLALAACAGTGGGPTEAFGEAAPRTVFVLAPAVDGIRGEQAEGVRWALMQELRRKGYGVTTAAEATLIPVVERWGGGPSARGGAPDEVAISARLLDREQRLLWADRGRAAAERAAGDGPTGERLAAAAVLELLRSLPDAPRR